MDFFGAQDPSYDSNMLTKVVFDKTAFVKFKNRSNDFNFILCDFYLCTQSLVYRGILLSEILTTVKTERSYLVFTGSVNISFGCGSTNPNYGSRFGFYTKIFAAFNLFLKSQITYLLRFEYVRYFLVWIAVCLKLK
jgi:hypothetical protein